MKQVAVILSGCGVYDGAEINEAVLTLLALEENGIKYQCFAPDITQHHVINHLTGEELPEKRNVLQEAARIVRGNIKPLSECHARDFAALVVPGGFGVAKNLSDLAFKGADVALNEEFLAVCQSFKGKPAGYICIAPALLPKIYGKGVELTIGNDQGTIAVIEQMGGQHKVAAVNEIAVDAKNQVVTTPAYMLAGSIAEAKRGIDKLVSKIKEMI
ncbi:MAG: isoprenoid biosynthesis glyoxalase ElbB [Enterobacteriaceae bacterium]